MSCDCRVTISGRCLSIAWAKAFIKCYEAKGGVISPAVVRFETSDVEPEDETSTQLTQIAEECCAEIGSMAGQSCIETVAGTIFPESIWRLSSSREEFFNTYKRMLPYVRRCQANRRGLYFQRMVAFPSGDGQTINQLEHIIETWETKDNHRHSALQAGIFDPRSDHSHSRQQGFPCLQQVAFHPIGANGKDGLSVVAFYANQTVIEKAFGNYLGLYRLGRFMADQMGLKLKEVVCIASALKLNNNSNKSSWTSGVKAIKAVLSNVSE